MLVLDLKSVPDAAAGKRLLALEPFTDGEALLAMRTLRVAHEGHARVPAHLSRVVAATLVDARVGHFSLQSFDFRHDEPAALLALEAAVQAAQRPVTTWGACQARSLLLARALALGLAIPCLLADHGPQGILQKHHWGATPLVEAAGVYGLPHRLGLAPEDVEQAAAERLLPASACDAVITYLLALGLDVAAGALSAEAAASARASVREWMAAQTAPHWLAFLQQWGR